DVPEEWVLQSEKRPLLECRESIPRQRPKERWAPPFTTSSGYRAVPPVSDTPFARIMHTCRSSRGHIYRHNVVPARRCSSTHKRGVHN
ncbi:hypothetical protein PV326_001644, partial [Microctonus aethiopoides]